MASACGGTEATASENETMAWRGNLPQVDDILFIGTKIPEN